MKHTDRTYRPQWISFSKLNLFAVSLVHCTIKNYKYPKVCIFVWPNFDSPRAKQKKKKKNGDALHRAKIGFSTAGKTAWIPAWGNSGKTTQEKLRLSRRARTIRAAAGKQICTRLRRRLNRGRVHAWTHPLENDSLADTFTRVRVHTTIVRGPLSLSISTIVSRNRRMQRKTRNGTTIRFRTHCGIFRPTKRRSIRSCIEHS